MIDRELRELTDGLSSELVPVPSDAADVCPICRSWRNKDEYCSNCTDVITMLAAPCRTVIPICLYTKPSPMRERVRFYKEGPAAERVRHGRELAAIVDRFFLEHGATLRVRIGGWDVVTIVPSTKGRAWPHPLETALRQIDAQHLERTVELLKCLNPEPFERRKPSDAALESLGDVGGKRILLLDDVYVTGSRAQSAASTLARCGGHVAAIVAVGRRYNPEWMPQVRTIWDRQKMVRFNFADRPWWAA